MSQPATHQSFVRHHTTSEGRFAHLVRRTALLACAAVAALGGCAPAAGPGAAEPPRPVSRTSPPPPSLPAPTAPVAFVNAPGSYRFVVTTEATIELSADSGSRAESRGTAAQVTYYVTAPAGGTAGALTVTGSVDSFTVTPRALGDSLAVAPVAFRGTIEPGRRELTLQPIVPAPAGVECGTPNRTMLALAREAIVVPPPTLRVGQTWEDRTSSTVCRGDAPLTTRAVHRYRVAGAVRYEGVEALHVTRASTLELAGEGSQRGIAFAVTGRGSSSADLYLDPARGRFLGGTTESNLELDLAIPGEGAQRFRQRARQRVEAR